MEKTGMIATSDGCTLYPCALLREDYINSSKYKLEWIYKGEKVGIKFKEGNEVILYISPEVDFPIELLTFRLLEVLLKKGNLSVSNTILEEDNEESNLS